MRVVFLLLPVLALQMTACADRPDQISPIYVAPETYASYDCPKLTATRDQLHTDMVKATRRYEKARDHDTGGTIMWGVFYTPTAPELVPGIASLKGNLQAVNSRASQTGCQMGAPPEVPPDPEPANDPAAIKKPGWGS